MNIHVSGGDARFARLALALKEYGTMPGEAYVFGDGRAMEEGLGQVDKSALVMVFSPKPVKAERPVVRLLEEEAFLQDNARLTAEGAIVAVANRVDFALWGARCLVVGFGRIGQALTELLVGLGARVTVFSRRERARMRAMERGAGAESDLRQAIRGARVVFSTPPERLLDEEVLRCATPGTQIVDLASPPYGVDLEAAERWGLHAWRESGVPGRYCPESAAQCLIQAVQRVIDRERSNQR